MHAWHCVPPEAVTSRAATAGLQLPCCWLSGASGSLTFCTRCRCSGDAPAPRRRCCCLPWRSPAALAWQRHRASPAIRTRSRWRAAPATASTLRSPAHTAAKRPATAQLRRPQGRRRSHATPRRPRQRHALTASPAHSAAARCATALRRPRRRLRRLLRRDLHRRQSTTPARISSSSSSM